MSTGVRYRGLLTLVVVAVTTTAVQVVRGLGEASLIAARERGDTLPGRRLNLRIPPPRLGDELPAPRRATSAPSA